MISFDTQMPVKSEKMIVRNHLTLDICQLSGLTLRREIHRTKLSLIRSQRS